MNKVLVTLAFAATCTAAFAQGKINMVNDANHLIYFGPSVLNGDSSLVGQVATQTATPSGKTFLVDLFGGTSAATLTLQQTTTISLVPGGFGPKTFISPTLPGGVQAFWEVKVRDAAFATAEAARDGFSYYGISSIFTFNPSSSIAYNSLVNAGGTALSTWAAGTVAVPGGFGAIELQVVPEPSTFALAGLGAAAMLIFRRRK